MPLFRVSHDSIPTEVRQCALTIGNFDGVHVGHQAIIEVVRKQAAMLDLQSVAVTFDPPPALLLRSNYQPVILTSFEQRAELLHAYGIDHVVILETNRALLNLEAIDFFDNILLQQFELKSIVEGANFQFGKNRRGTPDFLREMCQREGIQLSIVQDQILDGKTVSSSAIRQAIHEGELAHANRMLGRPYAICGLVEHGLARGRTIGFPTANLGNIEVMVPGHGVYAGRCFVEGIMFPTAIHVGPNVSFGEDQSKVECHLLGFSGDLYEQRLEVEFLSKLRETKKFGSVEELTQQMTRDVAKTAEIASRSR